MHHLKQKTTWSSALLLAMGLFGLSTPVQAEPGVL